MPTTSRLIASFCLLCIPLCAAELPHAVPTFNCIGLTWSPAAGASDIPCSVRYRAEGETTWQEALPLWYDDFDHPGRPERSGEYRGSLVNLSAGTAYEIGLTLEGSPEVIVMADTWSESFPIARTVTLPAGGRGPYRIREGGSAFEGYVLYRAHPDTGTIIDAEGAVDANVIIEASHVIVRGITMRGARRHGIVLGAVTDIVIEDCDISGWGENLSDGFGRNLDSAIYHKTDDSGTPVLKRIVIQRNHLHHPRSNANSWAQGRPSEGGSSHPIGPQGITFIRPVGEIVIRHNDIYSDLDHMFNDGMGETHNFSYEGFPGRDSDIYGNRVSHCWDDGLEIEGANQNVRTWGNVIDWTYGAIGHASTSLGPAYVFRNIYLHSRKSPYTSSDAYKGHYLLKLGAEPAKDAYAHGRIYAFHNTVLQPEPWGGFTRTSGAEAGIVLTSATKRQKQIVSRNNVLHMRSSGNRAIDDPQRSAENDFDYDLTYGTVTAQTGAEGNGIRGWPRYAAPIDPNRPWSLPLAPDSPGYDAGERIPNFNDDFTGSAPDMGAIEADQPLPPWFPESPPMSDSEFVNISTRGRVGNGALLIGGFVLEGSGDRTVLIRGIGPTLGDYGVPDTLPDPKVEVFEFGTNRVVAENDNWFASPDADRIAEASAAVGALSMSSALEAAVIIDLPPGAHTAHVTSADGAAGEGLVEVYLVSP